MKKKKYLAGALAALMMVGCTDELDENTGGGSGEITGNSFVKISLNLPSASGIGTRAENDDFNNGTEDEYAVNSTMLIVFKGASEATATVTEVVDLELTSNDYGLVGGTTDNITTSADATVQITTQATAGENLYGLVVVNGTVSTTTSGNTTSVTINGQRISKFTDLFNVQDNAILSNYIGNNKNSFLMLNAPLLVEGKSVSSTMAADDVMTLVKLTPYSEEDVQMAPATDIWVERAVAKVTVAQGTFTQDTGSDGELKDKYYMDVDNEGSIYNDDRAYLMGWYLNVTNKSTKVGHDVYGADLTSPAFQTWVGYTNATSGVTGNRFISADSRRVYWGIDGNYDGTNYSEEFNIVTTTPDASLTPGENLFNSPVYCFENTMDYGQMEQDQTTGIVFEMKYMFDANGDPETFFTMPNSSQPNQSYYQTEFIKAINTALETASAGFKVKLKGELSSIEGGYYMTNEDMNRLFAIDDSESGDEAVILAEGDELTAEQEAAILNAVGGAINVYENGTTYYYAARIQHFGDTYCDVENGYVDDVSDYETSHLGRYGVLRNNWYEIQVSSISGPGMPERPDPTPDPGEDPDPDDPKEENYIKCNINVLSWAVRKQNVEL